MQEITSQKKNDRVAQGEKKIRLFNGNNLKNKLV